MQQLFSVDTKLSGIVGRIERTSSSSFPTNFDHVYEWCTTFVETQGRQTNTDISFLSVQDADISSKIHEGEQHERTSPIWVGAPSEFFGKQPRSSDTSNIITGPAEFFSLRNCYLFQLSNVGIIVLDNEFRIIKELSTPFAPIIYMLDIDLRKHLRTAEEINDGCVVGDRFWEPNYAHWLLDATPRLLGAAPDAKNGKSRKYFATNASRGWQKEMMSLFGIKPNALISLVPGYSCKVKTCVVPKEAAGRVNHPAWKSNAVAIDFIRLNIHKSLIDQKGIRKSVLIITRKDSRKVKNILDLIASFIDLDFKITIADCSNLGVKEQWSLFYNHSVVIATHGAALANVVVMKPGSVVVEIMPKTYGNPAFWIVSSQVGATHICVTDVTEVGTGKKPRLRDVIVSDFAIAKVTELCNSLTE